MALDAAGRRRVKAALDRAKKELLEKAPRRIEPTRQGEAEVGGDEDEQPLAEMNQSIASNRNLQDTKRLEQIGKALTRLKEAPEEFGVCADCGDDIAAARLAAAPWVEFCVDCQSARDPKGKATRSKLTDYR